MKKPTVTVVLVLTFIGLLGLGLFWRLGRTKERSVAPVPDPFEGVRLGAGEIPKAAARAESGSVTDAFKVADHYLMVEQDVTNAIKYLKIAAGSGSAVAAFDLGQLYSTDRRVRDLQQASNWYSVAEKRGDKMASDKLRELRSSTETNSGP